MKARKPVKKFSKKQSPADGKYYLVAAGAIALLTFFVLSPLLSADFLNWDDPTFVLGNKLITSLSSENIHKMFTSYAMGNYCPLTILSWAVDYHYAGGLHPRMFHTTSLLLHTVNTFLVFVFVYHLSNKQVIAAGIASLLFGIHPMHLESVAWVAERRDVLYAMFYLLGLIGYLKYISSHGKIKYLVATLLFFVGSLLSKGQAVTFPLVLVVIDYIYQRRMDVKTMIEKVPFFILALVFGFIAIAAQKTTAAVNAVHLSSFESLFTGSYGLLLYVVKVFVPFHLSGYHPYPAELPMIVFMAPLLIISLLAIIYRRLRNDRYIIGGVAMFLLTIFPVLQFLPVGETIISERYTYIPYIGLFFATGYAFRNIERYSMLRRFSSTSGYIIGAYLILLCVITVSRTSVWKGPVVFWTDVIEKYPENKIAYNNRGYMYNELKQYDLAIKDVNMGISLDSTYGRLYLNRGLTYERRKMLDSAMADYCRSIRLDTTEPQSYLNRGVMYTDVYGKYDSGIVDFKHVLRIDPENENATISLGVAYYKRGNLDSAISQYNKKLAPSSTDGKTFYLRALAYAGKLQYDKAIDDANRAKQLGYVFDESALRQWEQLIKKP